MNLPQSQIPSRFRKQHFDSVAEIIGSALTLSPERPAIILTDAGKCGTLMRKLREALQAKERYGYTHSSINEDSWLAYGKELVVAERSDELDLYILVGTRHAISKHNTKEQVKTIRNAEFFYDAPNRAALETLLRIVRNFKPMPLISCYLTEAEVVALEREFEIGLAKHETEPAKYYIV